jgi:hypothetical protein
VSQRDLTVPNLLFIEAASSGLLREDLPLSDAAQPWPMQVSAMLCNESGAMTSVFSHIVKADGRTAKENAVKVHGISAWATTQIGVPEPRVLGLLGDLLKTVPMTAMKVVSYTDFEPRLISGAFARFGESQGKPGSYARLWERRVGTEFIILQRPWCQEICKLPSNVEGGDYRWPSLDEAAQIILGRPPREGFHDAFTDMLLLRDIYFALQARGFFQRSEAA